MLSYLHAFHAGNFADVQKHSALFLALQMMQVKPAPIACFDTHAGSALYDLTSERAQKTGEAEAGIQTLWTQRQELEAPDWAAFLARIQAVNGAGHPLTRYPGSPAWMAALKRSQDSVTGFELHPTEGAKLAEWAGRAGVQVRQQDGLQGLLKSLPPSAPRLLVLTDPSYEIKKDYQQVAETLAKAWRKCRHGVYLIWYPMLPKNDHQILLDTLVSGQVTKVLRSELTLLNTPERGMFGSGMLIVNPPWGFDQRFEAMMNKAAACLNARHRLDWLVPE